MTSVLFREKFLRFYVHPSFPSFSVVVVVVVVFVCLCFGLHKQVPISLNFEMAVFFLMKCVLAESV